MKKNYILSKDIVFKLNSKYKNNEIISNCFFISNEKIIVLTKCIYDKNDGYADEILIQGLYSKYKIWRNGKYSNKLNNENYNQFSIIKLINDEIISDNIFEIESNINISLEEKFIIDNNNIEKSIGKNILNIDNKLTIGTPIFIKKYNKKYLVGIIYNDNYHIFNQREITLIKNTLEKHKFEFYEIEELDFMNKDIRELELNSIFINNFYNLKYLNLENTDIINKDIIFLENNSLELLEHLNLSKNNIDDEGLKHLKNLSNLKELIILKMKLSDECFLVLDKLPFFFKNKYY